MHTNSGKSGDSGNMSVTQLGSAAREREMASRLFLIS